MKFYLNVAMVVSSFIFLNIAYAETFVVCVIKSPAITSVTINGDSINTSTQLYKKTFAGEISKKVLGGHGAYGPTYNVSVKYRSGQRELTANTTGNYYTHKPYMRSFSLKGSELELTPVAGCR